MRDQSDAAERQSNGLAEKVWKCTGASCSHWEERGETDTATSRKCPACGRRMLLLRKIDPKVTRPLFFR